MVEHPGLLMPPGDCLRIGCGGLLVWKQITTDQGTGFDATCSLCARVAKCVMLGLVGRVVIVSRFGHEDGEVESGPGGSDG